MQAFEHKSKGVCKNAPLHRTKPTDRCPPARIEAFLREGRRLRSGQTGQRQELVSGNCIPYSPNSTPVDVGTTSRSVRFTSMTRLPRTRLMVTTSPTDRSL